MPPQTTVLPYRTPHTAPSRAASVPAASLPRPSRPRPSLPRPSLPATAPTHTPDAGLRTGQWEIAPPPQRGVWVDRTAWLATVDGRTLQLTYLEFEVLDFFVRHPGQAYSREALLCSVWGHQVDDESAPDIRTVDVLVTRLRRKLGPEHRDRIETIRRVGYRYRPADPSTDG
ncbi:hypothetical protein ThrDRAFT_00036 [Frankia casuarinae]|uniref:Response regulator receiver protein n=2 Tax=Frankia casuarinae (strain DSM 45818 / CECT 9043 / HFP020203 / CcI3) TaxID=106370 RepID=Q2JGV9_FRACC|nr:MULTISPECIES: winged helix-turn-helix domain-containing protein [Frankia]ABD09483.1 response regulator receiver protein [Frankia casuarinae]ETA02815.1 hypothetical protein CcI6DRAFT_01775 [Frankia sp. CcI6]EYT94112.1 hypothetical protein ThrDRAFT_00036 [Frankia casuarinae]KDA44302.1 hypothetical protein BMG523Draft_00801 [Frankia sp. BMG5.23]KEZ35891.1 transcriptional regulatory protein [Frankia sp. CeD]